MSRSMSLTLRPAIAGIKLLRIVSSRGIKRSVIPGTVLRMYPILHHLEDSPLVKAEYAICGTSLAMVESSSTSITQELTFLFTNSCLKLPDPRTTPR